VLLVVGAFVLLAVVVVWRRFSVPLAQWLRSVQSVDVVTFLQEHLLAVGMIGGCLFVLALIWLPKRQASRVQDVKDRLTVENAARQTLAQIIGGAVLIAGLFFTWANLDVAQKNITITQETATKNQEIAREGQLTDRFTKAIAQLGEHGPEKLAVRLGGIHALARIAKDSKEDHWPIMEVLTAYVRETAPRLPEPPKDAPPSKGDQSPWEEPQVLGLGQEPPTTQKQRLPRPAADIQAILTALGRRTQTYGNGEQQRLDLTNTDLGGANLMFARLQGANLMHTHMQGANLAGAQLQGADLWRARLQGARLGGAQLQGADLGGAQLQGADLGGAQLQGADLADVNLEGAYYLTVEQLATTKTLYKAYLDLPLLEQIRQQYPQLLEQPQR
jgi:hypothetical protein